MGKTFRAKKRTNKLNLHMMPSAEIGLLRQPCHQFHDVNDICVYIFIHACFICTNMYVYKVQNLISVKQCSIHRSRAEYIFILQRNKNK